MCPEHQNGDFLASWKDIASFLKCSIRSCIRWEKTAGLPVHRTGDIQGSRVYASRKELEDWLHAHGNIPKTSSLGRLKRKHGRISPWFLAFIPVLILAGFLLQRPNKGDRPFRLAEFNIITAEPDGPGRLRVWGNVGPGSYRPIWDITSSKTNTVHHSTLAVGDIDGDQRSEVVVPTFAKATFTRGEKQAVYFKIFMNLYKQGWKGLWKSTFYNDGDCAWEERNHWANQVILANLDRDPASEIILKTATWLGVYDYGPTSGDIRLVSLVNSFPPDKRLLLMSVAAVELDGSPPSEIVVSANEQDSRDSAGPKNGGHIYLIKMEDRTPRIIKTIPIDAMLVHDSLCAGDVNYDGSMEIYTVGTRLLGTKDKAYLLGWNAAGDKIIDFAIPDSESTQPFFPTLAVSDLTFEAGDDLVVGVPPNKLFLFTWEDGAISLKKRYSLETAKLALNAVQIGDADGDGQKEVVVAGGAFPGDEKGGRFYLEVLGFKSLEAVFYPKWKRVRGEEGEREVWAVAIGRK